MVRLFPVQGVGAVQRLAGLMPSILLVLHLMPKRAGGCLASKSVMAHASANPTFERKTLSVHGCWAFRGTIHLLHTKLELDLLSIHHLLPSRSSPPSNVDVSNSTPSLDQSIRREEMANILGSHTQLLGMYFNNPNCKYNREWNGDRQ